MKEKVFILICFCLSVVSLLCFMVLSTKYFSLLVAGIVGIVMSLYAFIKNKE